MSMPPPVALTKAPEITPAEPEIPDRGGFSAASPGTLLARRSALRASEAAQDAVDAMLDRDFEEAKQCLIQARANIERAQRKLVVVMAMSGDDRS